MKHIIHPNNWRRGRRGHKLEAVVIHIMQGTLAGTTQWFKVSPNHRPPVYASSHCGIGKTGEIHDYVSPGDTSYHAGRVNKPIWPNLKRYAWGRAINPNYYTYGIENEGYRGDRWTEKQMQAIVSRIKEVLPKPHYTRKHIVSHHEIAADKENMTEWCDEIIKRLNGPVDQPTTTNKVEAIKHLEQALTLLKK